MQYVSSPQNRQDWPAAPSANPARSSATRTHLATLLVSDSDRGRVSRTWIPGLGFSIEAPTDFRSRLGITHLIFPSPCLLSQTPLSSLSNCSSPLLLSLFFCCFVSGHRSYPGQQHCFFVRLSKHTRRTPFCLKYFVSHPFSLAAFLVSSRLVQAGTLPGTGTPLFHPSHIRSSYTSILTLPTQARLHFV